MQTKQHVNSIRPTGYGWVSLNEEVVVLFTTIIVMGSLYRWILINNRPAFSDKFFENRVHIVPKKATGK